MRNAFARPGPIWRAAALLVLIALSTAPAFAQSATASRPTTRPATVATPAALPNWDRLSSAQREQLIAPVRQRWEAEPAQRARMLERAGDWQRMTPDQRQRAHRGVKRWEHLNPEQRAQMRALFGQMHGLSPERRSALKAQWRQMTPEQRRVWAAAHPPAARAGPRPDPRPVRTPE